MYSKLSTKAKAALQMMPIIPITYTHHMVAVSAMALIAVVWKASLGLVKIAKPLQ